MNWDIYNLPLTLVCFFSVFPDDAADEHSDGSPEDGQDDAGVWEREHEDGHVGGHEWVHSTHLFICFLVSTLIWWVAQVDKKKPFNKNSWLPKLHDILLHVP